MKDPSGAPKAPPERRASVGLSSSVVFLITIGIQVIGYGASYFTSHDIGGMGASGLTILSISGLYLLVASTLSGLGDLRVGSAYVFYVARGRDPHAITSTYLTLRLGLITVASAAAFLIALVVPNLLQGSSCGGLTRSSEVTLFGLFMLVPLLWSPGVVYGQLWVARGNSIRGQYPLLVQSLVQTAGLITVSLLAHSPQAAIWGIVAAYLIGGLASAVYSLPSIAKYTVGRPSVAEARRLFIYAWPLMGGLFLQYIASNTLPFFVADVSSEAVTIFLAANGFRILLMGLPNAVSVPLFPHLTNLHVQREYEQLRRRTWLALRYTAMLLIPAAAALVAYRSNLLDLLFGHNYVSPPACPGQVVSHSAPLGDSASITLALLAISAIPTALTQIILTALNSVGRQRLELYLQALSVFLLVSVSFLVLPPFALIGNWGLTGAAWAVLISGLGGLILNGYFLERILAVRIQPRPILAIVLSAAATFEVFSRLNKVFNPTHWYTLGLALVLGFTVYFIVLALSGELSKTDVRLMGSFLGLPASVGNLFARACWRDQTRDHGELLVGERGEESDATLDSTRIDPNSADTPQRPRGLR